MEDSDAQLLKSTGLADDSNGSSEEDEDEEQGWDALDIVDTRCSDMLGLDVHKMVLAEFRTPAVSLTADGFLELHDIAAVLNVLEDIAGELLLPHAMSAVSL